MMSKTELKAFLKQARANAEHTRQLALKSRAERKKREAERGQ